MMEVESSQDPLHRITVPSSPEALNRICEELEFSFTLKGPFPSKSQSSTPISEFNDLQLVIQFLSFDAFQPLKPSSYTQDHRFALLRQHLLECTLFV